MGKAKSYSNEANHKQINMKKLNLKLGSIKEMLTKEQMKRIVGGYDPCKNECETTQDCYPNFPNSTCITHGVYPYGTCPGDKVKSCVPN